VWVEGRKLVGDGRLLSIDLPDVLERSDVAARELVRRTGREAPWAWPAR
jgi:hypothetical protein